MGCRFNKGVHMDRIVDYVRWYSLLTFDSLPFNEVDNLVFCALSYWKFPDMNWNRRKYTLRECFEQLHGEPVQMMTAEKDEAFRMTPPLPSLRMCSAAILLPENTDTRITSVMARNSSTS